jgi:trehalose-6-phosphate synthase
MLHWEVITVASPSGIQHDRMGTIRKRKQPRKLVSSRGIVDDRLVLLIGLIGSLILLAGLVILIDSTIRGWTTRDLQRRAALVSRALEHDVNTLPPEELTRRLERIAADDRIIGVLACPPGAAGVANNALQGLIRCSDAIVTAAARAAGQTIDASLGGLDVLVTSHTFGEGYRLLVVQDRGFIWNRRVNILQLTLLGAGLTILVLVGMHYYGRRSERSQLHQAVRTVLDGSTESPPAAIPPHLASLISELNESVRQKRAARHAVSDLPGPEQLRRLVADRMPDTQLVLVANREPYIHTRDEDRVRIERPASGLVTGVEPLLRACGGVWIGHGSGNADKENSDSRGRLAVPPESPEYILRRIWMTRKEQDGYYFGLANEGLWPLCHIAHTRPTFRQEDWQEYKKINRRFAEAAVEEAGPKGLVLAQDYHYALLPASVRELAPDSVISLFWHIPWPNDEVFGIFPWKEELLAGMLGADVIGFHTRYHCLNFLDTAAQYLECRVDLETMSVEYQQRRTMVKPYPISIEWPYKAASREDGARLRAELGIDPDMHVVIGVDRADYTKGLIERVHAVERLFNDHPELVGKVVFVQLAAPSRSNIKTYRDFVSNLEDEALRVNRRFGGDGYQPIHLSIHGYSPREVRCHYAMADSALITPLHDGMNLVAKEYVGSCYDNRGVLILSIFAGAAKELDGALLVNPYDAVDVSSAIVRAIEMPEEEKMARMEANRAAIERNSIYDWSASLLTDMADIWEKRNASWRDNGA